MTITSNIHIGLRSWQANRYYSIGERVSNGSPSNAYECISSGTSGSGPTGNSSRIIDGGAVWKFLSSIDYTSLNSWSSAIPSTLTQPVVGLLWNDGTITTTAGNAFIYLSGHTTDSVNTITLKCAPGEGIRDSLKTDTVPLAFDSSRGVSFTLPTTPAIVGYVNISDSNVIIDGLQFYDLLSASTASIVGLNSGVGKVTIRNCIFYGTAQGGGTPMIGGASATGPLIFYNNLVVDHQATSGFYSAITCPSGATDNLFVNNTFVASNGNTGGGEAISGNSGAGATLTIKNCAILGYNSPISNSGGGVATADHCLFSAGSFSSSITDNGSNLFNKALANQFVSTTDYRLSSTSDCLDVASTDPTDLPTTDDIAGTIRPQGSSWDIGAWEWYQTPQTAIGLATVFSFSVNAEVDSIASNIHFGLSEWNYSTKYLVGDRVKNGGIAYECIISGISNTSTGPTGKAQEILDGSVWWKYLSVIDFTTLSEWAASIPSVLTEPVIAWIWNDGPITTNPGIPYITLRDHTTSTTNTITITCAPGESFRDSLAKQETNFAFNPKAGVSFLMPDTISNFVVNYFNIGDSNVILDGLQFKDPFEDSGCSIIGTLIGTGKLSIRNCILDGYGQDNGVSMIAVGSSHGPLDLTNTLLVDRQSTDGTFSTISTPNGMVDNAIVNCTFVSTNNNSGNGLAIAGNSSSGSTMIVRNCLFLGYFTAASDTGGGHSVIDHCVFPYPSFTFPSGSYNDGGGNIYNAVAANQVNQPPLNQWPVPDYDFRLKLNADCFNAGVVDLTNIPTQDDIARNKRPQSGSWDIGAYSLNFTALSKATIGFSISSTAVNNNPDKPVTIIDFSVNSVVVNAVPVTCLSTIFSLKCFSLSHQVGLLLTDPQPILTPFFAPKPDYLTPVVDPIFGTKITRIGGDPNTPLPNGLPGTFGYDCRHEYSIHQPWNSIKDLLLVQNKGYCPQGNCESRLFLDGNTYQVKFTNPSNYPATSVYEERWHPNPSYPYIMVMAGGDNSNSLVWYDVLAQSIVRSWTLPIPIVYFGNGKGNITQDGRLVLLHNLTQMFVLDMSAWPNTRIGPIYSIDTTDSVGNSYQVTWATISPSGKYVDVHYNYQNGVNGDWDRIYDVDPNTLELSVRRNLDPNRAGCMNSASSDGFVYRIGHSDFGINPWDNCEDVLIGQEECGLVGTTVSGAITPNGKMGHVVMVRLRDGQVTSLTDPTNESFSFHVSCRNVERPGWCYVTYWWPQRNMRFNGEVIAVKMDGSGSVERFCHTHSDANLDLATYNCPQPSWDFTYRSESQAVPSHDGRRVIFASNWVGMGNGSCSIQDYVVDTENSIPINTNPMSSVFD